MTLRLFVTAATFVTAAMAQSRPPVIVELFTSEGCSSCPAADNLLMQLEKRFQDIEVVAMGEHVDYWNSLGWQDRFSAPLFSARQQDYGRVFRIESVYTPQMVVNGQVEFSGSDGLRASREIQKAAEGPRADVELGLSGSTLKLKVDKLPPGTRGADMFLAVTESGLENNVQSGENAGHRLRHTGVVRSLTSLGHLDMKKAVAYSADAKLTLKPEWQRENVKVVLFVQDRSSRKILGAATLRP
jgi:hypothetical protein